MLGGQKNKNRKKNVLVYSSQLRSWPFSQKGLVLNCRYEFAPPSYGGCCPKNTKSWHQDMRRLASGWSQSPLILRSSWWGCDPATKPAACINQLCSSCVSMSLCWMVLSLDCDDNCKVQLELWNSIAPRTIKHQQLYRKPLGLRWKLQRLSSNKSAFFRERHVRTPWEKPMYERPSSEKAPHINPMVSRENAQAFQCQGHRMS